MRRLFYPDWAKSLTLSSALLYTCGLSLFGVLANMLALELPQSTPLLLGNLAFFVVFQRLGLVWGLACALIVLSPIASPLFWACSLLQILLFMPLQQGRTSLLVGGLGYFIACYCLHHLMLPQQQPWPMLVLSSFVLTFTLLVLHHCSKLFLVLSANQELKKTQPLQQQLASRIAVLAAIPWALMISVVLHGTVVLNLSSQISALAEQQQHLESQLRQKLSSYQAELKLASGYASLVGDELSLRQLVHSQPEFISALRTDASGKVLHFYKEQVAQDITGLSVRHRDYFQVPSATLSPYISNVFQGQKLGVDRLFALSLPLFNQQSFDGVLELSVALSRLTDSLTLQQEDPNLTMLLIDGKQLKIWGFQDDRVAGKAVNLHLPSLSESEPYLRHSPFFTANHLHYNQAGTELRLQNEVLGTEWQLLLLWDHTQITVVYQMLTLVALLLLLAGFEFMSRSSQRFVSGYTAALQQLITAVERMELGSDTWAEHRLQNSALEFEQLLSSFKHMQLRLHTGHQQLQSALTEKTELSERLEQRVAERTAELSIERDKAQQLALAKTRFLANMSHELRTPLTIILGFVEQLLNQPHDPRLQSQLQTIASHSTFLLQIVNDILDAAKMDEGKLPLEMQNFELLGLLKDLHQSMLPTAQSKELDFELNCQYPLPRELYSDPLRLKQILMNLLGNALKFTEKGKVTLQARLAKGQLQLTVSDTGPGITSEQQAKLFAAFEQADPSISRQYGGTGLGLYICKQLTDLLGFELELRSETGQGTSFSLLIPLSAKAELILSSPPATATAAKTTIAVPRLSGSVLIVDDVPDLRLLLTTLLSPSGLQLETAINGLDALQKVARHSFDLILMDMHMPVMDGLSASRELRRQGYTMPIIALTADVQQTQQNHYLDAGCQAVLSKPVQSTLLFNKITELLQLPDRPQSAEEVAQEQMDELTEMYRESLPKLALELQQNMEAKATAPLAALLHRIKGTSACFGFHGISSAAAEAERLANAGEWPEPQLQQLLQHIEQEQP